jgi:hypothetical protein
MDKVQKHNSFNTVREICSESSPKGCRREELATCRSVWLSCISQHTSMYEDYGSRDLEFQ